VSCAPPTATPSSSSPERRRAPAFLFRRPKPPACDTGDGAAHRHDRPPKRLSLPETRVRAPPPSWRPRSSGPRRRETLTGVGLCGHGCGAKAVGPVVDAETGFQCLRARYYDPATGQFLTRDPIEAITREPYGYVGGNPLNATDPSGLFCVGSLCTPKSVGDVLGFVETTALVAGTVANGVGTVAAVVPGGQGVAAAAFGVGRVPDGVGALATCGRVVTGSRDVGDCAEAAAFVVVPNAIERVIAPGQSVYRRGRITRVWDRGANLGRGGLALLPTFRPE